MADPVLSFADAQALGKSPPSEGGRPAFDVPGFKVTYDPNSAAAGRAALENNGDERFAPGTDQKQPVAPTLSFADAQKIKADAQAKKDAQPRDATLGSVGTAGTHGAYRGLAGLIGMPADFGAHLLANESYKSMPPDVKEQFRKDHPIDSSIQDALEEASNHPMFGSEWFGKMFEKAGVYDQNFKPQNIYERVADAAGDAAIQALAPGMAAEASMAKSMRPMMKGLEGVLTSVDAEAPWLRELLKGGGAISNTIMGIFGGATGEVAKEVSPDLLKPTAEVGGNMVGGGVAGVLEGGTRRLLSYMGMTKKMSAAKEIAQKATDAEQFRTNLANTPPESTLTTGAAGGDAGVAGLQKSVSAGDQRFTTKANDQNDARLKVMDETRDPAATGQAVKDYIRGRVTQIEDEHASLVGQEAHRTAESLTASGGDAHAHESEYGAALREPLAKIHDETNAKIKALYEAVAPNKSVPTGTNELKVKFGEIQSTVAKSSKEIGGEEGKIGQVVRDYRVMEPFSELIALRGRLADAVRDARGKVKTDPESYNRLNKMLQTVDETMADKAVELVNSSPRAKAEMAASLKAEKDAKFQKEIDESLKDYPKVSDEQFMKELEKNLEVANKEYKKNPTSENMDKVGIAMGDVRVHEDRMHKATDKDFVPLEEGGVKVVDGNGTPPPVKPEVEGGPDLQWAENGTYYPPRQFHGINEFEKENSWRIKVGEVNNDRRMSIEGTGQSGYGKVVTWYGEKGSNTMIAYDGQNRVLGTFDRGTGVGDFMHAPDAAYQPLSREIFNTGEYASVNGSLRGKKATPKIVEGLDREFVEKGGDLPKEELFRSITIPRNGAFFKNLMPGSTFADRGYFATTPTRSHSEAFLAKPGEEKPSQANVQFHITPDSQAISYNAGIKAIFNPHENEYVLNRGTQFKVNSVEKDEATGVYHVNITPEAARGAKPDHQAETAFRYAEAMAADSARGERFTDPVNKVLRLGGDEDSFRMANEHVAGNLFDSPEKLRAFVTAAGDDPNLPKTMQDYAAFSMRRAAARDGQVSQSNLTKWISDHEYVLDHFPELRVKFADAAHAQATLDNAVANQKQALSHFQDAAVNKVLGEGDLAGKIGGILDKPEQFNSLIEKINTGGQAGIPGGDAAAKAGLKRTVVDHIVGAATKDGTLNGDTLDRLLTKYGESIDRLFTPEELANIKTMVSEYRAEASVGEATATAMGKQTSPLAEITKNTVKAGMAVSGFYGGRHFGLGGLLEVVAAAAGYGGGSVIARGVDTLNNKFWSNPIKEIITEAMLNPKLAEALMTKFTIAESNKQTWQEMVARRVRSATLSGVEQASRDYDRGPYDRAEATLRGGTPPPPKPAPRYIGGGTAP